MTKLNLNFQKLSDHYLFPEIERKIAAFQESKSDLSLLNLGVGDVSYPIFSNVIEALNLASLEMGNPDSMRGYGPSEGYLFLREAIAKNDYKDISADEIFISDGANSDLSNIQELFSLDNRIGVLDPAYPVYIDTNVIAGRTKLLLKTGRYGGVTYLACEEKNDFQPQIPDHHLDLIYLCSPNNPTGVALTRKTLENWVNYAKNTKAIILFDGAYEAFITSDAPRSIYEIEGAKEVAIEIRSFSKSAGFTGLRCSYCVVPKELTLYDAGKYHSIHALWKRRVDTKSNGVSYPIQKAALALYSPEGRLNIKNVIQDTLQKGGLLLKGLKSLGYTVYGGMDSPYIWLKAPPKISSWKFFDFLLENMQLVTIPGSGFGLGGEGFIRLSAFAPKSAIQETLKRFARLA